MKKISFIVILIMTVLFACNKEEVISLQPNSNNKSLETYLKVAGEEHNKGLDYVYEQLQVAKENKWLNVKNGNNVIEAVKINTVSFLKNHEINYISSNSQSAIKNTALIFEYIEKSANLYKNGTGNYLWSDDIADSLSQKQKELLTILNEAILEDNLDLEATLNVFEIVRNRANLECIDNEKFVVIAAIEVGTNSLIYWHENLNKWKELLENYNKASFSWKQVGAADVGGAVCGLTYSGVCALFGPIGWGAVAANTLGCALGGSAGDAVIQLLK